MLNLTVIFLRYKEMKESHLWVQPTDHRRLNTKGGEAQGKCKPMTNSGVSALGALQKQLKSLTWRWPLHNSWDNFTFFWGEKVSSYQ